jgi:hypothetical protein
MSLIQCDSRSIETAPEPPISGQLCSRSSLITPPHPVPLDPGQLHDYLMRSSLIQIALCHLYAASTASSSVKARESLRLFLYDMAHASAFAATSSERQVDGAIGWRGIDKTTTLRGMF